MPVTESYGDPREIITNLLTERERWEARLQAVEERLETLRERYAGFLTAAKAHLEVVVEKAEAPLRFAVTDHTFLVVGWVPQREFSRLREEIGGVTGVFVAEPETIDENESAEAGEPPVRLQIP